MQNHDMQVAIKSTVTVVMSLQEAEDLISYLAQAHTTLPLPKQGIPYQRHETAMLLCELLSREVR